MIILDTNVISALMRKEVDPIVVAWLDSQPTESIWLTAVTVFELHLGLELLAPGRRRRQLEGAFARALDEDFEGRILPFEREAARTAALLAARQQQIGRPIDFRDVRSPGSPRPAALPWRRGTPGTSRISGSRSSIRGPRADDTAARAARAVT
jgi:toxin FitB